VYGERGPRAKQTDGMRTCSDCGETKSLVAYTPITSCIQGWYGRCRVCRARRARERYHADPQERMRQIERVRRNRIKRQLQRLATSA